MNTLSRICNGAYALVLYLFPRGFQKKFGEELRGDFAALLEEARKISPWEFLAVCLRELRDLPMNLLRTHLEKKRVGVLWNSPTLRFSGRGALAFGLSFAGVNLLQILLDDYFMRFASNYVKCFFMPSGCQGLVYGLVPVLAWAVASVLAGGLFALLFTGRHQLWWFSSLAALAFMVGGTTYMWLPVLFGLSSWFSWVAEIFTGLLLGFLLAQLAEKRVRKITLIAASAVVYPLLAEMCYHLVLKWFPPVTGRFLQSEVNRNVFLEFLFTGILFGIVMGIILGWRSSRSGIRIRSGAGFFEKDELISFLRSRSWRILWRTVLYFSLAFVLVNLINLLIYGLLVRLEYIHFLSLLEQIRNQRHIGINDIVAYAIASMAGGLLFAAVFARVSRFWALAAVGTIAWLAPGLIYREVILYFIPGIPITPPPWQFWAAEALAGLCLAATVSWMSEGRLKKLLIPIAGAVLYPLLMDAFTKIEWMILLRPRFPLSPLNEAYRTIYFHWAIVGILFGLSIGVLLNWKSRASKMVKKDSVDELAVTS